MLTGMTYSMMQLDYHHGFDVTNFLGLDTQGEPEEEPALSC